MSVTSTGLTSEVFHVDELLARCLGSLDFATRVLARFQDRFEEDLLELDQAISTQDADAVRASLTGSKARQPMWPPFSCEPVRPTSNSWAAPSVWRMFPPASISFARSGRALWTTHPTWD